MGSDYELPKNPELTIVTSQTSIDKSVSKILEALG